MLKNLLIISIASTFFMACKSNKETAASAEKTTTEQVKTSETKDQAAASATTPEAVIPETKIKADSVKEDLYRFTVVFFSIGEGTENKYMTAFEDFIGVFAGKVGKNVDYEKTGWGREGETDYCLRLN